MQIFLYEYTCASPKWHSLPQSLRAEGRAMLSALVDDFQSIAGLDVITLVADGYAHDLPAECVRCKCDEKDAFVKLAHRADYTLAVAPEIDGLLEERRRWIDMAGGKALMSSVEAIRQTADKFALARHFESYGIPTPATYVARRCRQTCTWRADVTIRFPAVIKPRFGAGSQATYLVRDEVQFANSGSDLSDQLDMIYQPYIQGQPTSACFLVGPGSKIQPLMPGCQLIAGEGLVYEGGEIPLHGELAARLSSLAGRAIATVPGLLGYIGVDLVAGAGNAADFVIEINPRLTTSYVGLRHLAKTNLAQAMLCSAFGESIPIEWHAGKRVRFLPNGQVTVLQ